MNPYTLIAVAGVLASCCICTAKTPSSEDLAQAAEEAYIFAFPLVMNYHTMYSQAIKGDGEFGKWVNFGTSTPADKDIVTPNNDTPYSYAWVDLRAEPWVLTLPKIEPGRFYTSQWDDLWGFVIGNPGSLEDGNDGVTVMVAAPDWKGSLPKGVKRVIQGESSILGTLTRTQLLAGEGGINRVKEIQKEYRLQPLSRFLGETPPPPASKIDWIPWTKGDETKVKFWDYVALLLPLITPNSEDEAMYKKLALLGIERGKPFDSSKLPQETLEALQEGIDAARAKFEKLQSNPNIDAGKLFGDRAKLGTNYLNRAMGVYLGIFGNVPKQSVYYSITIDDKGEAFDGAKKSYQLKFAKDQIPPVKYFWSVTMYGLPDRLLVKNPIDRYSIGSSTEGLKAAEDGSITLYVSNEQPSKSEESNWLPAPKGPFWMVLRTYGPGKEIIDHHYKVPPVESRSLGAP